MNINVFLLFFSFVFSLSSNWERERGYIKLGIRRSSPKVCLSYFDGFLWRIFLLLRALLLPGVHGFSSVRREPCPTTNFLIFLFPLTGRRCHFRFRVPANHLASTFFLPMLLWRLATVKSRTGNSSNHISIFSVGHHVTIYTCNQNKDLTLKLQWVQFCLHSLGFVSIFL